MPREPAVSLQVERHLSAVVPIDNIHRLLELPAPATVIAAAVVHIPAVVCKPVLAAVTAS